MKKICFLSSLFSLILLFANCSKDEVSNDANGGNDEGTSKNEIITIQALLDKNIDTKTTYSVSENSIKVDWLKNEKIKIYKGTQSSGETFTNGSEGGSSFTGKTPTGAGSVYYGVYPDTVVNTNGELTFSLSDKQTGVLGDNGLPGFMVANATNLEDGLNFKHLITVLKLTLTFPEDVTGTVSAISISGMHNKATYSLSDGTFSFSNDDLGVITANNNGEGFAIDGNQVVAYMAVFPETVQENSVMVSAQVGSFSYGYTLSSSKTLNANKGFQIKVSLKNINYRAAYNVIDYFQWDAHLPYENTKGDCNETTANYNPAKTGVAASHSCKNSTSRDELQMYFGAGVYYDDGETKKDGLQTYILPNGTVSHIGLWMKKKEFIEGFNENEATKETKGITPTAITEKNASAIRISGQYFFVPAVGYYINGTFKYDYNYYWTSTIPTDTKASRLAFGSATADSYSRSREAGMVPLVSE